MKATAKTPAEVLANKIAVRLVKEALLTESRADKFSAALAGGKLKAGDWRLAIEAVKPTSKPATT